MAWQRSAGMAEAQSRGCLTCRSTKVRGAMSQGEGRGLCFSKPPWEWQRVMYGFKHLQNFSLLGALRESDKGCESTSSIRETENTAAFTGSEHLLTF